MKRTGIPSPAISGLAFNVIPETYRSHSAIQAAVGALDYARARVEDQRKREGPIADDPTETEQMKAVLRAEIADLTIARVFPRIDRVHDGLLRAEKAVELAAKQAVRSPDRSLDAEIRRRFASMGEKDRDAALTDAVEEGDLQVVGTLVSGPAVLSSQPPTCGAGLPFPSRSALPCAESQGSPGGKQRKQRPLPAPSETTTLHRSFLATPLAPDSDLDKARGVSRGCQLIPA